MATRQAPPPPTRPAARRTCCSETHLPAVERPADGSALELTDCAWGSSAGSNCERPLVPPHAKAARRARGRRIHRKTRRGGTARRPNAPGLKSGNDAATPHSSVERELCEVRRALGTATEKLESIEASGQQWRAGERAAHRLAMATQQQADRLARRLQFELNRAEAESRARRRVERELRASRMQVRTLNGTLRAERALVARADKRASSLHGDEAQPTLPALAPQRPGSAAVSGSTASCRADCTLETPARGRPRPSSARAGPRRIHRVPGLESPPRASIRGAAPGSVTAGPIALESDDVGLVDMSGCGLTDHEFKGLLNSICQSQAVVVSRMDISGNCLTDHSAVLLAAFLGHSRLRRLRWVDMRGNLISVAGAQVLREGLRGLPHLAAPVSGSTWVAAKVSAGSQFGPSDPMKLEVRWSEDPVQVTTARRSPTTRRSPTAVHSPPATAGMRVLDFGPFDAEPPPAQETRHGWQHASRQGAAKPFLPRLDGGPASSWPEEQAVQPSLETSSAGRPPGQAPSPAAHTAVVALPHSASTREVPPSQVTKNDLVCSVQRVGEASVPPLRSGALQSSAPSKTVAGAFDPSKAQTESQRRKPGIAPAAQSEEPSNVTRQTAVDRTGAPSPDREEQDSASLSAEGTAGGFMVAPSARTGRDPAFGDFPPIPEVDEGEGGSQSETPTKLRQAASPAQEALARKARLQPPRRPLPGVGLRLRSPRAARSPQKAPESQASCIRSLGPISPLVGSPGEFSRRSIAEDAEGDTEGSLTIGTPRSPASTSQGVVSPRRTSTPRNQSGRLSTTARRGGWSADPLRRMQDQDSAPPAGGDEGLSEPPSAASSPVGREAHGSKVELRA